MVTIDVGSKLTIITHEHVLMCTVTQVRVRDGCCCEDQDQPHSIITVADQPQVGPEASILIEVEVEDGVTRRSS